MKLITLIHAAVAVACTSPCTAQFNFSWIACQAAAGISASDLSQPAWDRASLALSDSCMPAIVPGTALVNLLNNKTWQGVNDPFQDSVLLDILPDISAVGAPFFTFIFSTEFVGAPNDPTSPFTTLVLPQVNYRAQVWVNGMLVTPVLAPGTGSYGNGTAGMYQRFLFNITSVVRPGAPNALSILVLPPDHAGNASDTCHGCGQGGNHAIAQDVSAQDSAGWDWIGGTPDRNTGILEAPVLSSAGAVLIRDPTVVVSSLVVDIAGAQGAAYARGNVTFTPVVAALSLSGAAAAGTLCVSIYELNVSTCTRTTVPLAGGSWTDILLPDVNLTGVELWWPHGMGSSRLYTATAAFVCDGSVTPSSNLSWQVGFRQVSSQVDANLGGRVFLVNGQRVFLRGGNWISPDQLNRFHSVPARWAAEVAMHKHAGLNIIRLWGGSGGAPPALYEAADELGVLLMFEGWMTGDNNGRWAGSYAWPLDHSLYLAALRDTMFMVRGHASLLFWCGGNELYPIEVSPPPDILAGWNALVKDVDYSSRPFVASSMTNMTDFDPYASLAPADGPYGILDEREFAYRNPGMWFGNGSRADEVLIAFQPEVGSVSSPEYESMARFLSPTSLNAVPMAGAGGSNVTDVWQFHRYIPFTDRYGCDHVYGYGTPTDAREYAFRASLAQYRQYQALYEGFTERMWEYYGTVILWKSQSPWPSFRGALYDWYLQPTGGLWGARAANSNALHAQLNFVNDTVTLVNTGQLDVANVTISVALIRVSTATPSQPLPSLVLVPVAGANSATRMPLTLAWPGLFPVNASVLVRLTVTNSSGAVLDVNDYWVANLSPLVGQCQNYSELHVMRQDKQSWVEVSGAATATVSTTGVGARFAVSVTLPPTALAVAFAVRVSVHSSDPSRQPFALPFPAPVNDPRVLPCFAAANYFSLLPGQGSSVSIDCPLLTRQAAATAQVYIDGWNIVPIAVTPTSTNAIASKIGLASLALQE